MADPIASIVIPNYNGLRFLPRLFDSLRAQSRRDFEIVVVDDRSTDDSLGWLEAAARRPGPPSVRLVRHERNLGFAGTCNAGLRASHTPFAALLNNDTHVDAAWFEEGLRPFDDPAIGSVASLVLLAEPPHLIDSAGDVLSVAGGAVKRLHGRPRDNVAVVLKEAFSACGASAFLRRAALDEVGLLDESFISYYEDVELGARLQWAGWRCVFAPASICYHYLNASYDPHGWAMHYNSARNAEVLWWRHLTPALRERHLGAHLGFLTMQLASKVAQGNGRAYLAGKWRAVHDIRRGRGEQPASRRLREEEFEARLVADWWGLHVGDRMSRRRGPGR